MNEMENTRDKVCAVVVTYNRKKLLLECLEALRKQTRPLQGVYLIDNASTDGTPELLLKEGFISELPPKELKEPWEKKFEVKNLTNGQTIDFYYIRMHENTGGAGGFHEGLKRAYERVFDWFWLMDDDTIANVDSLEKLFEAKRKLEEKKIQYSFLSSVALWLDGTLHKMNIPSLYKDYNLMVKLYPEGLIPLRGASFVSLLISKEIIENYGYPIKDFFIWNDDVEYTYRISKYYPGFWVLNSYVIHKTLKNYSSLEITKEQCWKVFFEVRNKLYILLYSKALTKGEKIKFWLILLKNIINFIKVCKTTAIPSIFNGLLKGVLKR